MVSYITLLALTLACRVASDSVPTFDVDDNTAPNCVEWYNNAGRETCDAVLKSFGIPRQDFHEMNPSVGLDCQPFNAGQSFCLITQEKLDQFTTKSSSSSIVTSTSTSSVFSLGPSPTAWNDKGCYVENEKLPILEQNMSPAGGDSSLSVPKCKNSCYRRAYAFAGLQAGNQCWCGNYIGGEWTKNQTECNIPCTGDKAVFCGGKGLVNIFEAQKPASSVLVTSTPVVSTTTTATRVAVDTKATSSVKTGGAKRNMPMFWKD
ncbi:hypothetical protein E8E13_001029 [Curvularia kusanoi]|uniref:WSC domain-containing protein n=1 Tax=Curvularia kusanoi TaxID=90978 RepID=A0A9P4T8U1_CURKU|nr:hypothetical protein E8E13_001029 [Curvularia kusanoi]